MLLKKSYEEIFHITQPGDIFVAWAGFFKKSWKICPVKIGFQFLGAKSVSDKVVVCSNGSVIQATKFTNKYKNVWFLRLSDKIRKNLDVKKYQESLEKNIKLEQGEAYLLSICDATGLKIKDIKTTPIMYQIFNLVHYQLSGKIMRIDGFNSILVKGSSD